MAKPTSGEQLIHRRNPNFQKSREVVGVIDYLEENGSSVPNSPEARIAKYIEFLGDEDFVNDGILTGYHSSVRRQIDSHVINTEDFPESYFTLRKLAKREKGHGDVELSDRERWQTMNEVQREQAAGLEQWVECLGSGHPDWFKFYVWESLVKLGSYDKDRKQYKSRSRHTTALYPEYNDEALAYVYDVLVDSLDGKPVDSQVLTGLLKSAEFGKLYVYAMLEARSVSPEKRVRNNEGKWHVYPQTEDPRTARLLSKSLNGYGTGWCTAGDRTAARYLEGGDHHVFYTRDNNGDYTVPRVTVAIKDGLVSEVRGIESDQNVESTMLDVAIERMQELPGGADYPKKVADMRRLTDLEKMINKDEESQLSLDDVRFLYEIDGPIEGFGRKKDPRIAEVRSRRGDRDREVLSSIVPEMLIMQARAVYDTYMDAASKLAKKRGLFRPKSLEIVTEAAFVGLLERKEAEWHENGLMEYLVNELIENGSHPYLVATPNVVASRDQITELAKEFGDGQPCPTHITDSFLEFYKAEELSGAPGKGLLRLSVMSSTCKLSSQPSKEHRRQLKALQSESPELNFRVPSVLEAVMYWRVLRSLGAKTDGEGIEDITEIHHFDLSWHRYLSQQKILKSSILDDTGEANLRDSDADKPFSGRLSVG